MIKQKNNTKIPDRDKRENERQLDIECKPIKHENGILLQGVKRAKLPLEYY